MTLKKILFALYCTIALYTKLESQIIRDEWVNCGNGNCQVMANNYIAGSAFTWEGTCKNNKANGYGVLKQYIDNSLYSTYTGNMVNGEKNGQGTMLYYNGTKLNCTFIKNQANGSGKIGNIINGNSHGLCHLTYGNGSQFDGFGINGKIHDGKFIDPTGKIYYYEKGKIVKKRRKETNFNFDIGTKLTLYYNENWEICEPEKAKYYRLITFSEEYKPAGVIKDFYMNGSLQSEYYAVYLDPLDDEKTFHINNCTWYYPSGKINRKCQYLDNKVVGTNATYYENGILYKLENYDYSGNLHGKTEYYYSNGKIQYLLYYVNGNLVNDEYYEFDENGIGAKIKKINFEKEFEQTLIYKTKEISSELTPNKTILISSKSKFNFPRTGHFEINQKSDYSIDVKYKFESKNNKSGHGFIFGFQDWDNYCFFQINQNSFHVIGMIEGTYHEIIPWTRDLSIVNGNLTEIKLMKSADMFNFYLNSHKVAECSAFEFRKNEFGVCLIKDGTIEWSEMTYKEFISVENSNSNYKSYKNNENNWLGSGSGFFISMDGHITTNYHVIENANEIEIEYVTNGKKLIYSANVVKTDKVNDLAILKINDPKFKNVKIPYAINKSVRNTGEYVFALGFPMALTYMGDEVKFTDGKISSNSGYKGDRSNYQISVPIQPGNSGGPLIDENGNIIGIVCAKITNADNVGYAVKSEYLIPLMNQLNIPIFNGSLNGLTLVDKIKKLSESVVLIKVK